MCNANDLIQQQMANPVAVGQTSVFAKTSVVNTSVVNADFLKENVSEKNFPGDCKPVRPLPRVGIIFWLGSLVNIVTNLVSQIEGAKSK